MNYQRLPVEVIFKLDPREPDVQTVEAISREIVDAVNRSHAESEIQSIGPNGSELPIEIAKLFEELDISFAAHESLVNNPATTALVIPKPVLLSGVMSRMGVSGVYSPLTGEPNFNSIQPDSALPFTLAHEIAHRRGFARESEASFIAFLVCINSKNAYVRYSGYLQALRVLSLLRVKSPERHREVVALLAEGPRVDLRASQEFWRRYSGRLSAATRTLNNVYLRANRVKSGIRNYGEVTTLIVAYYLTERSKASPLTTD